MKHLTIAIALESAMLKTGIRYIISTMKDAASATITDITATDLEEAIRTLKPTVAIVDTESVTTDTLGGLRSDKSVSTRIIGVYHSAMPARKVKLFDYTISIYDSAETIKKLISRCLTAKDGDKSTHNALTAREKEIIVGVVKGLSNKEIASAINVSVNTVMTHRRNITSKLHIHSPAGLTIYALVSKLVTIDEVKSSIE